MCHPAFMYFMLYFVVVCLNLIHDEILLKKHEISLSKLYFDIDIRWIPKGWQLTLIFNALEYFTRQYSIVVSLQCGL